MGKVENDSATEQKFQKATKFEKPSREVRKPGPHKQFEPNQCNDKKFLPQVPI